MKTALITGASSGIGADSARHLSSRGYSVILVARREEQLELVAKSIGENAFVEVCDSSSGAQVMELAQRVTNKYGTPDVVVNCAGGAHWKFIEETTPAEALEMIQAPYLAAFNVTQVFTRGMLDRRSGTIIHVNSPACFFTWPSSVGYASARWALRGLHESLCQDLAGTGVQSCHVVFGKVNSPYFEHNPGSAEKLPSIARTIRALSTDEAGRIIAQVVDHPKREFIYPFILRVYVWSNHFAPALLNWLLRITGSKRL